MVQLDSDELQDLKRILYWTRFQQCNKAIRIDSDKFLNLIKQKENGRDSNSKKTS